MLKLIPPLLLSVSGLVLQAGEATPRGDAVAQAVERQKAAAARQAQAAARQSPSLARQSRSIERQSATSVPQAVPAPTPSFYTVPWPDPPPLPASISMNCTPLGAERRDALVAEGARSTGLSPDLLRAVVEQESGFRPCVVSSAGAMGLMQLMPATAAGLGVTDPFDPLQSVLGGSRYLRDLMDRYGGSLPLALGAYNAGPSRVDRARQVPAIPETQRYVSDILSKIALPAISGISDSP